MTCAGLQGYIRIGDDVYDNNGRPFKTIGQAEAVRRQLGMTDCFKVAPVTMTCIVRGREVYRSGYRIRPKNTTL